MSFRGLEPWMQPSAEALVRLFPRLRVTSVYRSYSEQLRLWNTRAQNPFPVAPPGRSKHQLRRAWDMEGPAADLQRAGALWERAGGRWGGRFGDPIHFEA